MTEAERRERNKAFTEEESITFNMLNEETIEALRRGDISFPYEEMQRKVVNIPKDERWNMKQITSKLMQGILQGDSIPKISKSLYSVVGNNKVSATRTARTLTTQAENRGRIDSFKNLDGQGVVQEKVWIATPDSRTRKSHLDVDSESVAINDTFSNGLEYPADPNGDPAEVYNCRCSMRTEIIGFRRADGSISYVDYERDETMHAGQMDEEKQRRIEKANKRKKKDNNAYYHKKFGIGEMISEDEKTRIVRFGDKEMKIMKAYESNFRMTKEEYEKQFEHVEPKIEENNRILENNGFTEAKKKEFFEGDMYVRFGAYSVDERSIDFTKLSAEQRRDITEILSDYPERLEKEVKFLTENTKSWKGKTYEDLFEEGVSVFKSKNGVPVIENLTQAQSMAVRLDSPMYAVDGKVIGKGHDGEPLLKDTVNMRVSFEREKMENVIIDTLKKNFDEVEGIVEHGGSQIFEFTDWKTGEKEIQYCGLTFRKPKNKKWASVEF